MNIKKNVTGIPFQNTVTILYLLSGCLWILIADVTINAYFSDPQNLENYYIYKSFLYVVITATGLYWLLAFIHNKEIQNKEAFTNSILETANVGICLTDEQGNFVQVNQTFFDLFGHSKRHFEGTHLR